MRLWPQPPLAFHWVTDGDVWQLQPSRTRTALPHITVRPEGDFWTIYVHDRPVHARYTGCEAAKREAWLFAHQNRRAFFGAYRIKLEE